jgi:hypothetical protein
MKVPQGRPTIAHRFNGGFACRHAAESRRDDRIMPPRSTFFRPSGACSHLGCRPTVETVGYSRTPLPGLARTAHDALVGLVERILTAQRASPSADTTALEREIDARVYRLYALTQDEIELVE